MFSYLRVVVNKSRGFLINCSLGSTLYRGYQYNNKLISFFTTVIDIHSFEGLRILETENVSIVYVKALHGVYKNSI